MRLRFSKLDAQWLADLASAWQSLDGPMSESLAAGPADPASVRRWIARVGRPRLPAFFRLASARWAARRVGGASTRAPSAAAVAALYRRSLRASLSEPLDLHDLAIDGDDLRSAGIAPGPRLGKTLAALLDRVLADPTLNTREQLLTAARQLVDDDE
jgi:tRNA nucleotidyltransferase (CCA-adding enzyme)